ncbi:MAG: MraY family glycosyltransferase [Myxococcota bacterium]
MTIDVLLAFGIATLVASLAVPLAGKIAWKLGAVDTPGGRRVHAQATPRMGGLAVLLGFLAAVVAIVSLERESLMPRPTLWGLLASAVLIAMVGAVDDVKELGARKKLLGQVVATTLAWSFGARFESLELPWLGFFEVTPLLSYFLTLFWVLAFVNAINLIDGLDGLAGGIVLFACITNTVVAFATGNMGAGVMNAALGGAVFGFLFHNFNPARIFLGDTGSMLLGFVLATAALTTGRQKESTLVAFLVPVIALGVPLIDTLFTMLRRFLANRPIFSPDRGHIHHRLLDLGLTHRRVVLGLYGATVVMCGTALLAAFGKDWVVGGALVTAAIVVIGGARFAGYFQVKLVGKDPAVERDLARIRRCLPSLVVARESQAPDQGALGELARRVLEPVGFLEAEVFDATGKARWRWEREPGRSQAVGAQYEVAAADGSAVLRVSAPSDHSRHSRRVEALLHVAMDAALGTPMVELAHAPVPSGLGETLWVAEANSVTAP